MRWKSIKKRNSKLCENKDEDDESYGKSGFKYESHKILIY